MREEESRRDRPLPASPKGRGTVGVREDLSGFSPPLEGEGSRGGDSWVKGWGSCLLSYLLLSFTLREV